MSALTEKEIRAISLLADILRRVNQTYDVIRHEIAREASVEDLRGSLEPPLAVLRDDVVNVEEEAIRYGLIDTNGFAFWENAKPQEATP